MRKVLFWMFFCLGEVALMGVRAGVAAPPVIDYPPLPIPQSIDEVERAFPRFEHVPYDKAGCNLLVLPFRYKTDNADGDRAEADAFAFLMSADLDWIPGNYCTRHAYFVFSRDKDAIGPLRYAYTGQQIADRCNSWGATAAVGGQLRWTKEGIAGTLEYFDSSGKLLFGTDYPPQDYFHLLGEMDVDAMRQAGYDPPAALADYLHQARCQHAQSLVAVGHVAFQNDDQLLDAFAKVLESDPSFAEVHAAWANRYAWTMDFTPEAEQQKALALRGRIVNQALTEFYPSNDQDAKTLAGYHDSIDAAARLVGEDAPAIVDARLQWDIIQGNGSDPQRIKQALALAAKYPNGGDLMYEVGSNLLDGKCTDAELAGAVAIADAHSLYSPGIGDRRNSWRNLAIACDYLGMPNLAEEAYRQWDEMSDDHPRGHAFALLQAGHFQEVIDLYESVPLEHNWTGQATAGAAALAAAMKGEDDLVASIREKWATEFDRDGVGQNIDFYLKARGGTPIDYKALPKWIEPPDQCLASLAVPFELLADLSQPKPHFLRTLFEFGDAMPTNRFYWILMDAYIRETGHPRGDRFYEGLKWLYPDDTWVARAAAQYAAHRPAAAPPPETIDNILLEQRGKLDACEALEKRGKLTADAADDALHSYLNPFDVAGMVHYLLVHDRIPEAQTLAARFHGAMLYDSSPWVRAWAQQLVRLAGAEPGAVQVAPAAR